MSRPGGVNGRVKNSSFIGFIAKEFIMSADTITAICALFVSVIATALALWSAWEQRKYMRLSVRPIAAIVKSDFENRIAVYLENKGLGPMLIRTFRVKDKYGTIHDRILSHMPVLKNGITWSNFHGSVDRATLQSGKKIELLLLEGDKNNTAFQEARDVVRKSLKNLTVSVEYEDIYGVSMKPREDNLVWFGRNDADYVKLNQEEEG